MPIFIVFFELQPKFAKKNGPKKNDNFSHFAKHRFIKKPVLLQPPFWPKIGVFQLGFLKPKTMMLNKNITQNQQKNKDKKRDFKEKRRQENIDEGKLCNWIFWCCSFHETKAEKKEKERRDKNKEAKESKKERQEGKEKMTRRRERQRKKNWKRGRPKKAKDKQRETLKNKQIMPFSRGKTRFFFVLQSKERKGTTTNQKKQKINKFGGFRAKWGGPLGHLTWSLNPPQQKKQNKKKKNKKRNRKEIRRV